MIKSLVLVIPRLPEDKDKSYYSRNNRQKDCCQQNGTHGIERHKSPAKREKGFPALQVAKGLLSHCIRRAGRCTRR